MTDLRNSKFWDKELEGGLPDCRLTGMNRQRTTVMHGRMEMEIVFCAQCHQPKGMVTAEWTAHVFFICDDCFYKMNGIAPPGTIEVPESVVQNRTAIDRK